jgi:hypothetical protein
MDVLEVRSDDVLRIIIPFYNYGKPINNLKFYPINMS